MAWLVAVGYWLVDGHHGSGYLYRVSGMVVKVALLERQ